jgi:hypothetical protein
MTFGGEAACGPAVCLRGSRRARIHHSTRSGKCAVLSLSRPAFVRTRQEAETHISASPVLTTGGVRRLLMMALSFRLLGFGTHRPRFSHAPAVSRHVRTSVLTVAHSRPSFRGPSLRSPSACTEDSADYELAPDQVQRLRLAIRALVETGREGW